MPLTEDVIKRIAEDTGITIDNLTKDMDDVQQTPVNSY